MKLPVRVKIPNKMTNVANFAKITFIINKMEIFGRASQWLTISKR